MNDPRVEELLEHLYVSNVEKKQPMTETFEAEAIAAARDAGYLRPNEDIEMTPLGEAMARDVVRRHRLAECLLHNVLSVSTEQINPSACRFEHIIQQGLDEKICILLGHPAKCPHGKDIPPGACCVKAREDHLREVGPLCDGKIDAEGVVAYLQTTDQKETQKLMAIGVLPGVEIRLVRRFPSYVFSVAYSQFTVDRALAEKIYVHWKS